jgi:drug/metabolite transporter (DMT)-like permease
MLTIVRHLSADFHVFFIVMMRNTFSLLMFTPLIIKTKFKIFKTGSLKMHFFRSLNGFVGMALWFSIINSMPLPELVSFTFTVPIITTLMAMYFLKEKVSKNVWVSLFIGLVGILVIARPGFQEVNPAYFFAILTTILWSITNILIKMMTKTETPQTIVAYMSLLMLIMSLPFGLFYLKPLNIMDIFWFSCLGFVSNFSHIFMSKSYQKVDMSVVQPFDFMRLIFISIIAYFVYDEVIDFYTLVGSAIIMVGVIFIAPKKKVAPKVKVNF